MSSPSSTSSSSSSASSSYSMPNQSISRRSKNHNVPVAFDQDKTNGDDVHFSIRNSNISDDEQLDDRPFLSHRLSEGNESFSEKFLRNILTPNYQNLMPRRREKFVEIIKTVTVTEVVNGGSDHPSKCEVKVTNVSPGPIPVNVSIKHHHEKFHSCEDLQQNSTGTSTVIRVHRSPFEKKSLKHRSSSNHSDCNQIRTTIDEKRIRSRSIPALRNLEFTHPILIETSKKPQMNGNSARPPSRQNIGDVRKRTLSKTMTTTTTETTETEKVMKTTKRRSSSSQSGSRSQDSPEVQTLYYRKFIETTNDDDEEEKVKLRRDSFNRRSRSEDHRKMSDSPPIPPQRQRKVLGREESLHYYRDDDEVVKNHEFCSEKRTNETTSINDSVNQNNFTAGVTRVLMNDTCADSSRESKSSTIPRNKINHIEVKVTGPSDDTLSLSDYPIVGHVGDDITMKFYLDEVEAPPKPPRRSKGELRDLQVDDDNVAGCIGEPLMTSTPMTTIQRKINRESVESDETPSRKSTKSSRPPDINIIECEMMEKDSRSPARTPNTPIVVVNQTPTSRRSSSQDLLSDQSRRRKNTVTDIDWYAAFNMKDPPSPAGNLLRISQTDGRKSSQEHRRRASESSINIPAAEIDLNQIFCTANYKSINDDDKCKCNACRLTRMNDEEIQNRFTKAKKIQNQDLRSNTLPTRRFVPTIEIELDEVFNPKKPPTPPKRSSIRNVFSAKNGATSKIDHEKGGVKQKNLSSNDTNIDWIGEMIKSTKDWEESSNRKISTSSSSSSLSRKSSITRKISIEKLKQSKRCQTSEMILPPSKTSIDEIVTALTSKPQNLDSTKTFLITRKWTNQEMEEALDSNKIEKPIAPPRRLNQKQRKLSEANINENTTNYDDGSESTIIFSQAYKNPSLAINIDELNLSNTGKNKKTSTSIRSETKNQEKSEDPSSSSTVNLDDVFVSTSEIILKSNQDDDKDKKIFQRISEFRENQCTKDLKTEQSDPTVPRTLNESNIDINDIFTSKPTSHLNPIVINKTTTMTEVEEDSESEKKTSTSIRNETKNQEKSEDPSSSSTVNLDDVFVSTSGIILKSNQDDDKDKKISQRISEFRENQCTKDLKTEQSDPTVPRTLNESNIDINDIFTSKPTSHLNPIVINKTTTMTEVEEDSESEKKTSTSIRNETKNQEKSEDPSSSSTVNLDDVFVSTSGIILKSNQDDDKDKKISQRISEFRENQCTKDLKTEQSDPTVPRTLNESNIDINDIFTSKPTSHLNPIVINKTTTMTEVEEDSESEKKTSTSIRNETKNQEKSEDPSSSSTVNLDDVFVSTSGIILKSNQDDDKDKKISQRISEFRENQCTKDLKTEEADPTVPRTLNESNIDINDIFTSKPTSHLNPIVINKTTTMTEVEEDSESEKKTSTSIRNETKNQHKSEDPSSSSTVNLDDVFVSTSGIILKSNQDDDKDKKISQRISEFRENQCTKDLKTEEADPTVPRTLNESNIDINDIFTSKPTSHLNPIVINKTTTMTEVEEDSESEKKTSTSIRNETKNQHKSEDPSSSSTVNLDDVFVSTSGIILKSNQDDDKDKKISQRISEFRENQCTKDLKTEEADPTVPRTLNESNIDINDIFTSKPTSHLNPIVINKTTTMTEVEEDSESEKKTSTSIRNETKNQEKSEDPSSSSTVNIDDVFVSTSGIILKSNQDDDKDKKISQRISEFRENQCTKDLKTEEADPTVPRTLNESNIDINDIFTSKPTSHLNPIVINKTTTMTEVEEDSESEKKTSTSIRNETKNQHKSEDPSSSSTVNLDDVFVSTSGIILKSNQDDDKDKKISQRISEFRENQCTKDLKTEEADPTVPRTLNESNIDINDIFTSKPTSHLNPIVINKTTTMTEVEEDSESEKKTSTSIRNETKNQEKSEDPSSSSTVNLDDVFVSTSGIILKSNQDDDKDKKISQRISEFRENQCTKDLKTEEADPTVPRTLNESNIDINDIFTSKPTSHLNPIVINKTTTMTEVEEDSESEKKTSTSIRNETKNQDKSEDPSSSSTVNLDDVFVSTSGIILKSNQDDDKDKKISQRISEFRENQCTKDLKTEQSDPTVPRTLNESNIDINDIFTSKPTSHLNPIVINKTTTMTEVEEDSESEKKTSTSIRNETKNQHKSEDPSSSSTVNLDDVFVSTSEIILKSNQDDDKDKKISQRISEFRENQCTKDLKTEEADPSVPRTLNESNIDINDIFTSKPTSHLNPIVINKTTTMTEVEEDSESEKKTSTSIRNETKNQDKSEDPSSSSTVNLDDVFVSTSGIILKSNQDDDKDKKISQRISEFRENQCTKDLKTEQSDPTVPRTLNESNIDINDIFTSKPTSHLNPIVINKTTTMTEVEEDSESEKKTSTSIRNETKNQEKSEDPSSSSTVNLDDVFVSTSGIILKSNQDDDKDKKISQRISEFRENQCTKDLKTEQSDPTVPRTLNESNIDINDIFTSKPTSHLNPIVINKTTTMTEVEEDSESEKKTSTSIRNETKNQHKSEDPSSSSTVNLDDVFVSTSGIILKSNQDDDKDKKISQRISEFRENQCTKDLKTEEADPSVPRTLNESNIDINDIFTSKPTSHLNPIVINKTTTMTEVEEDSESEKKTSTSIRNETKNQEKSEDPSSSSTVNLDDVFVSTSGIILKSNQDDDKDKKISQRISEFRENQCTKDLKTEEADPSVPRTLNESNIDINDIFTSKPTSHLNPIVINKTTTMTEVEEDSESEKKTSTSIRNETKNQDKSEDPSSSSTVNLDDVFVSTSGIILKSNQDDDKDKKISQRISEFRENQCTKDLKTEQSDPTVPRTLNESNIDINDIFTSKPTSHLNPIVINKTTTMTEVEEDSESEKKTSTSIRNETKNQEKSEDPSSSSTVNLDDVFVSTSGIILKSNQDDDKDKKISQRISEFRENQCTKDLKTEQSDPTVPRTLNESNIDINDIFTSKPTSHLNPIVINKTTTMTEVEEDSESEKKTSTSIRNETKNQEKSEDPSSSSTVNLDDVFVSTSGIILKTNDDDDDVRKVSRQLFNNSIVSDSTISLENSFNSRKNDDSDEKNVEKILQNNWISDLVKKERKEEKEEGDETWKSSNQKKSISIFNQSPTRISSEIKYEWISDILSNNSDFDDQQIDQISGENDKKVWISSATYHPTIDSSTYTLKAHNSAEPTANEMNSNFDGENEDFLDNVFKSFECHSPKASEMDQCVCSACRLSQLSDDQLAELRQKWRMRKNIEDLSKIEEKENVEEEKFDGDASSFISIDDLFNFQKSKSSTINAEFTTETKGQVEGSKNEFYSSIIDEINLDEILPSTHPTESLHIETCDESSIRHPTTPSPTIINTKTYVLSPRVSITETIRQNHEWKREKSTTTNNEEILSPSSMISDDSSRQDSRRFSTFYEDRANGWDTIRSEDSGVMSSTGGRLSRNIVDDERKITELVIDEAFKDIFDEEEKKKKKKNYDDYYISSLNEERNESDSESSAKFLDVTQFVDEILGKSMDEAAFLSSTKSFQQRNHTDTSIDCKKSMKHPYYRLRTDTSNDRKTTIISEDNYDQNGEGMKSILTKSETSENTNSTSKTSDEEILEIEVNSDAFLVKGSYSLVIPKNDPLGQLLEKIYAENQSFAKLDVCLTKKIKKLLLEVIKEKGEGNVNYYKKISRRGNQLISSTDYASSTFLKMNSNKFDLTKNPNGIVNFCTAENNICTPLLEEHFKHIELFFPNTEHLVRYPPSGGWLETRETLVKYFKKFMNADIDVSDLVLTASTRTGYDIVSYCLFEPNDILLTNGPVYSGTISNCNERAKCVVECVKTNLMAPKLDVNEFEKKLQKINKTDQNVAGIIIVNPHNPLGIVFPAEDVIKLCNWASSHNLKVIIDEVFSNCVFDKSARFDSFLSYYQRLQNPEDVVFLWSVSKDFGMPGLKFAVIHSKNLALQNAATKLQMYFPCSPFVQDFAVKLLNDHDWLTVFHKEVKRRIEIHYNFLAKNLNLLEIPFVSAQAGIFVFADFSKFLKSIDEEAELNFWQQLGEGGVMLTPGVHQKCDQFGWFRIVYACSKEELEEGVRRLYKLLKSPYQTIGFIQY